ncbi:winged helix domain-containing protein [Streptomyces broussonetiae]|uniref:winged helix domain-containing protein n=1 Tax=Streptomyces broussonetiae TaxID=2686304 RepID=UPI0035D6172B
MRAYQQRHHPDGGWGFTGETNHQRPARGDRSPAGSDGVTHFPQRDCCTAPRRPHARCDTVPVDGGLRVRLTTARAVLGVGEDAVTLSAAGTVYEFAPEAEAVLRPLVDGRTVDLATLAETASLALEDVAALVQELAAGQAAKVGSLL